MKSWKKETGKIYFNTCASGLVSGEAVAAGNAFVEENALHGSVRADYWRVHEAEGIRKTVAAFLHAEPHEVAFVPNLSFGLHSILSAIKGKVKRVMMYEKDYPALLMTTPLNGFDIAWFSSENGYCIDLDQLQHQLLKNKSEALIISHVQWLSGFKVDLKALGDFCRQHEILLIVDATQSYGGIDIRFDDLGVDVMIGSNYKWMNAGFGSATLCIRSSFIEKYPPTIAGYGSYHWDKEVPYYAPWHKSFEPGHLSMSGLLQLKKAVEQKQAQSMPEIEAGNKTLMRLFLEGLESSGFSVPGGYETSNRASFFCIRMPMRVREEIEKKFVVSFRDGKVRVGVHYYNNADEVNAFLDVIKRF